MFFVGTRSEREATPLLDSLIPVAVMHAVAYANVLSAQGGNAGAVANRRQRFVEIDKDDDRRAVAAVLETHGDAADRGIVQRAAVGRDGHAAIGCNYNVPAHGGICVSVDVVYEQAAGTGRAVAVIARVRVAATAAATAQRDAGIDAERKDVFGGRRVHDDVATGIDAGITCDTVGDGGLRVLQHDDDAEADTQCLAFLAAGERADEVNQFGVVSRAHFDIVACRHLRVRTDARVSVSLHDVHACRAGRRPATRRADRGTDNEIGELQRVRNVAREREGRQRERCWRQ